MRRKEEAIGKKIKEIRKKCKQKTEEREEQNNKKQDEFEKLHFSSRLVAKLRTKPGLLNPSRIGQVKTYIGKWQKKYRQE